MQEPTQTRILDTSANPAPLGLLCFGMTTVLLNIINAGLVPLSVMVMGMGIFVGGLAQVIAGVLESKKNNTFGMTAFTSYGFFWISLVCIWVLPKTGYAAAADETSMGYYLSVWGLYSFAMFIGTFRISRGLQVVFGLLVILFILLAVADFTANHELKKIAGYEGILCGLSAMYVSFAAVLNEVYGRVVLPIGLVKK
jgi:succinate-acetate transporter protein